MKKKLLPLFLSALLLLPTFSAKKNGVTAEENALTAQPTPLSSMQTVAQSESSVSAEDVTVCFGFESELAVQYTGNRKAKITYVYDESLIQIKNGVVKALVNQPMTVPVLAYANGGHSCTFNVIVKTDASIQQPGAILTNFDAFFEQFASLPFDSDKMTFFVGDSFFDQKWFYTDFYDRFEGKNAACLGVGSTMSWQWYWVGQKLYRYQPENIVVHIGSNDLHAANYVTEGIYADIVNMFAEWHENMPNTNMYWFTIEPRVGQNGNREKIQILNNGVKAWAADKDWLTVIDSFTVFADNIDNGGNSLYKPDGLHLKCPEGYDKVMELAYAAGLEISDNSLYNTQFAVQGFTTDKNTPNTQFIGNTESTFVYETEIKLNDCKNLFDHIAFDTVGSGDDRFMLWNSKYDGKFRFEGYFSKTDYEWADKGTATHFAEKGNTVKVAILRTERNVYFFVNNQLECVLLNAKAGEVLSVYTQSVSAEFTNCFFDGENGALYQSYAQKAEIEEYENSLTTAKTFYYDLAE